MRDTAEPTSGSALAELRGAARVAFDATAGLVDVVERMHRTVQRVPSPFGTAVDERTRGITGLVYRSVRGGVRLAGLGVDALLAPFAAWEEHIAEATPSPRREALRSALNGLHGDRLAAHGNPLAIGMSLRHGGHRIAAADPAPGWAAAGAPPPTQRLLVLVHGLCMNDLQWRRDGHDHGAALAASLGCSPLYLRYNSGLPVADNGRRFADQLEALVAAWPQPVEALVIVGHSMGGLVARSACHHAQATGQRWRQSLRRLVFLGTPHLGAPLQRVGQRFFDALELSPYAAPLARFGRVFSAGMLDLEHGTITDGPHRDVPLPDGVACFALGTTLAAGRGTLADRLVGDGLVPLDSALGRDRDPKRALSLPPGHRWIGHGIGHFDLLSSPAVYERLRTWLAPAA